MFHHARKRRLTLSLACQALLKDMDDVPALGVLNGEVCEEEIDDLGSTVFWVEAQYWIKRLEGYREGGHIGWLVCVGEALLFNVLGLLASGVLCGRVPSGCSSAHAQHRF